VLGRGRWKRPYGLCHTCRSYATQASRACRRRPQTSSVLSACQRALSVAGCACCCCSSQRARSISSPTIRRRSRRSASRHPAQPRRLVGSAAQRLDSVALRNDGEARCRGAPRPPRLRLAVTQPRTGATPGCCASSQPAGLRGTYHDSVIVSPGTRPAARHGAVEFVVQPCVATTIALDVQFSDSLTQQSCAARAAGSFAQLYSFTGRVGDSFRSSCPPGAGRIRGARHRGHE